MASRQREYQRKMRAEGRCQICGKPEVVPQYCKRHRDQRRRRYSESRGEGKQEHTCTLCGKPGHNRRTCERREEETAEAEA